MTKISIDHNKLGTPLGDLYGLFFEDLNHAADGGLYAEMVHNRSFELCRLDHPTYHPLYAWEDGNGDDLDERSVALRILSDDPLHPKNTNYLKINSLEELTIRNRGYNQGMYLRAGDVYQVSFFAKPDFNGQKVTLQLQDSQGTVFVTETLEISGNDWCKYEVLLTQPETLNDGRLALVFPGTTDLAIDMISVFPQDTFKGRVNGCRKDIAEKLQAMQPKFMRFPGGCLVHDGSLNSADHDSMYRWKNTIGPVETRATKRNNWGYNQSLGLGFFEYFQLCEDLGAKPIPVLPAGWDPHHQRGVPFDELDSWIQDALDLIEFANGDATSTWGKVRADMGHVEPFNMEYLGIGNEEVGQEFFDRYTYFHQAIRAQYPAIKLINSAGPFSAGSEYDRGWESARLHQSDLVDEHYYATPEWFLAHHHRYDSFDAKGPKVFLGEYAAKANRWWNALAEASYMIGLERNADKVTLACYAPLLANVGYVNWRPNLIWFDQESVYGSVNYDVQKLFMSQQGTHNVDFEVQTTTESEVLDNSPITGEYGFSGDGADITIDLLTVTDLETGESVSYEPHTLKDTQRKQVGRLASQHYKITFDFIKTGGSATKGFKLFFGHQDEQNYYDWSLGGWQNQDSLISRHQDHADSVLTQSIWKVNTNETYHCSLEVKNRQITTTINGQLFNETEDLPLVIKPAYINAVYDQETDTYILKVVNVRAEAFTFQLTDDWHEMVRKELSADVAAENSLANPQQVTLIKEAIPAKQTEFRVSPRSVMFLELRK